MDQAGRFARLANHTIGGVKVFKLNGEDAQEAWNDYRGFLESIGGNLNLDHPGRAAWIKEVERGFKFAFAAGKAAAFSEGVAIAAPTSQVKIIDDFDEPEKKKPHYKRRSDAQMEQDARLVASIMQRNGGEMALQDITAAVNAAGGDWYEKSASGHMIKVMERIPAIKKVGFGLYKYEQ